MYISISSSICLSRYSLSTGGQRDAEAAARVAAGALQEAPRGAGRAEAAAAPGAGEEWFKGVEDDGFYHMIQNIGRRYTNIMDHD